MHQRNAIVRCVYELRTPVIFTNTCLRDDSDRSRTCVKVFARMCVSLRAAASPEAIRPGAFERITTRSNGGKTRDKRVLIVRTPVTMSAAAAGNSDTAQRHDTVKSERHGRQRCGLSDDDGTKCRR